MSTSDKLALAALIVSFAAFCVSLLVAVWEVVKFRREGARVRVRMLPGVFDDDSLATTGHPLDAHPKSYRKLSGRFDVEVARIEVENRGRSPVTIQSVQLDLGRHKWWSVGRRTVIFPLLEFDDFETRAKVRLDPYDSATFMVNMNHALWALRQESPKRLVVRASATVVGYRTVRSSWLKRWTFDANTPPRLWLDEPFDLAREIYRFLYRDTKRGTVLRLALPEIAMKVAEHVETSETATPGR